MEDRNRETPRTITRQVIILADQATEGAPSIETTEITEIVEGDFQQTTVTKFGFCAGCGKALHKPEDVIARCICGNVLCPDTQCSGVKCSEEGCLKILCPGCRSHSLFGDAVLCRIHARKENIGCFITLAIPALLAIALVMAALILARFHF